MIFNIPYNPLEDFQMTIIISVVLSIIFAPLAVVILANARYVSHIPTMRFTTLICGLGVSGLVGYWILRSFNIIEANHPIALFFVSIFFIMLVVGLYSVFGVPLYQALKGQGNGKKI